MAKKKKTEAQRQMDSRQRELQNLIEIKKLQQQAAEHPDEAEGLVPEEEKIVPKTRKEKWDNYWYHYKTVTFASIIGVVLLAFLIKDLFFGVKYDMDAVWYTGYRLTALNDAPDTDLALYTPDRDGNGEINVLIDELPMAYTIDEETGTEMIADEMSFMNQQKVLAIVASGDPLVYIVDSKNYDKLLEASGGPLFADLSSYFPGEERVQGDKLILDETDLGHAWKLDQLDETFYLCIRPIGGTVKEKMQDRFDAALEMAENILNGRPAA